MKHSKLYLNLIMISGLLLLGWEFDSQAGKSKSDNPRVNTQLDRGSDLDSLEELESSLEGEKKSDAGSKSSPAANRKIQAEDIAFEDEVAGTDDSKSVGDLSKSTVAPSSNVPKDKKTEEATKLPEPDRGQGTGQKNEIVNLEFKMEGDVSRLLVTSRARLKYRELRNSKTKQLVYLFENTSVPERLERAYDTSEFVSPVALFTLLQVQTSKSPVAKLIIQLREDKVPSIANTERGMHIDFSAPEDAGDSRVVIGDDAQKQTVEETSFSASGSYTGKPIERLEIKNTDIQDVIRLIGRSSGYNIVIGDDVTGKIGSLSLENIPWDQAFALVLQAKKLGYVRQGNVLRVATLTSLKSEKEEIAAVEASRIKAEPLRTVMIPISYAKAADLAPRAKPLMSDRGSAEVDPRTNSIIVRDVDKVIGKLQKLFAILDTQPPVVSVSAKVVEMKSSLTRSLGINLLNFSASTSGVNIDSAFQPTGTAVIGPNIINISAADFAKLDAQIGLSEVEGLTKVLANPSVSVNQNEKGSMSQNLTNYFPITQVTGGVPVTTLTPIESILSLDVTPIVASDGTISMTVGVKNEVASAGAGAPSVDRRSVQTQIILESGDTAVIGGAFKSVNDNQMSGVPGLMKLPLIGALFSGKTSTETKNEILIFLTAKILNTEESFKRTF